MAKKKRKSREEERKDLTQMEEVSASATTLHTFLEETQYTETSYTSASLETLPTPQVRSEINFKGKKKRKKRGDLTDKSERSMFSSELMVEDTASQKIVNEVKKKKKSGKKSDKSKNEEPLPKFDKPKNWKKMNVREREDWLVQRIEQYKQELEASKIAQLAGAKEKKIRMARERNELMAEEVVKQNLRCDILAKTCNLFQKHENLRLEHDFKDMLQLQWKNYLKCNGLPDPTQLSQLHSYLSQWSNFTYHDCTEKELEKRFHDIIPTLDIINLFTTKSCTMTPKQHQNLLTARTELQNQLKQAIECTSFNILRDLDSNLQFESTKTATYHKQLQGLKLHVWVAVKQPTKLKRADDAPPEPVILDFPDVNLNIILPIIIRASDLCVRVSRSQLDLCSQNARTYELAVELPDRNEDLFTFNVKEFTYIHKISIENEETRSNFYKENKNKIRELEKTIKANPYLKSEKEKEEIEALNLAEHPPLLGEQNPRLRIIKENDDFITTYLNSCVYKLQPGEIDLRKDRICGGVLHVDLFQIPPQAKYIRHDIHLSTLILPNTLKDIIYRMEYKPTRELASGDHSATVEEIEMSRQKNIEEREKMIAIDVLLSQDVIWLEQPTVCQWQESEKIWTSKHVFDVKYDRRDFSIKFRSEILWPIGIAAFKYNNMPYKDWDLRKDPNGKGVLFSLTGVFISVKILCRNRSVVLKEVSYKDPTPLDKYINQSMSVAKMKRVLQEAGCDIFPDFDAHNYIKKSCPKTWVPERHLYHAMAFLSKAYNFRYSRWNTRIGSRFIMCQIREHTDKKRESKYQLLYSSPESTSLLRNGEDMDEFNDEPASGHGFYPDLYTLNMSYGSTEAKKRTYSMSYKLTETIFELLQEIKPLSFS